MRGCLSGPSARQARTSAEHRILRCCRGLLLALAACANEPSRLDNLGSTQPPPAPHDAALRDETDRDLERRLREGTARTNPVPLDAAALGARPRPFGPLRSIDPDMTRAELLAALPELTADGAKLWIPTSIDTVTVDLSFDRGDRLHHVTFHLPLAARSLLITTWGAPPNNLWLDPASRWRTLLREDAVKREIVLVMSTYTPFAALLDRLDPPSQPIILARATDVCSSPTELIPSPPNVILVQCYDELDVYRRAILHALEKRFGRATPSRTADDHLIFSWPRVQARHTPNLWAITIGPR